MLIKYENEKISLISVIVLRAEKGNVHVVSVYMCFDLYVLKPCLMYKNNV